MAAKTYKSNSKICLSHFLSGSALMAILYVYYKLDSFFVRIWSRVCGFKKVDFRKIMAKFIINVSISVADIGRILLKKF